METLVRERATTNILLLLALNLALFAGLWLVYRNLKKALQLAQAKSDFVSNVSHEIRTPLSLISMFAETLQMNRIKDESKKYKAKDSYIDKYQVHPSQQDVLITLW